MLIIVVLMSFGERARHGHYHFDGGRGWDFAPNASLDAGHAQLHFVIRPREVAAPERIETAVALHVSPLESSLPRLTLIRGWWHLRPPPQA